MHRTTPNTSGPYATATATKTNTNKDDSDDDDDDDADDGDNDDDAAAMAKRKAAPRLTTAFDVIEAWVCSGHRRGLGCDVISV
jgi:hypothetical protein